MNTVRAFLSRIGRSGGRIGGKSRSVEKILAARANGHLGGRPRKQEIKKEKR